MANFPPNYPRTGNDLPDYPVLCYPVDEYEAFKRADDHGVNCFKPSSEFPREHVPQNDNIA